MVTIRGGAMLGMTDGLAAPVIAASVGAVIGKWRAGGKSIGSGPDGFCRGF